MYHRSILFSISKTESLVEKATSRRSMWMKPFVQKGQMNFQELCYIYEAEMEKAKAEAEFNQNWIRKHQIPCWSKNRRSNELAMAKAKYEQSEKPRIGC